jgi:hypothetical protein
MEQVFDFSRAELEMGHDDVVVRTVALDDDDVWVDVLHTPSGRRAYWNHSGFDSIEEAIAWVKTT